MIKFPENTQSTINCPHCDPPRKLVVKTNRHTDHHWVALIGPPATTRAVFLRVG